MVAMARITTVVAVFTANPIIGMTMGSAISASAATSSG
jgi:hypothetical protein